jgi:FIMAH domain-containing protein/beta-propeller repeat-containing protein
MANLTWTRRFLAFAITAAAVPASVVHTAGNAPHQRDGDSVLTPTVSPSARAAYVHLPLRFEPAHETSGGDVYVARGAGYAVSVSAAKTSLLLRLRSRGESRTLTMSLAGGNADARVSVRGALPGISNYLIGGDRRSWVTGVRGYREIEYRSVYRGVDIVYYGSQQQLEYDFVVAPGASADPIALAFDGATRVSVSADGDLVVATDSGNLVQRRPAIYQNDHGARRAISGGYIIRRGGTVGFSIGSYDRRLPLVIDPVLSYATYLGGVNQERGNSVAVDAAGNVIVAGVTYSSDFPVGNALQSQKKGSGDAFVAKLNPTGDALVYSTYFGGGGTDEARDVAVDDAGNAYVAGYTDSWDFPAASAIGSAETRKQMFVVKLDSTGALAYATLIGGSGSDDVRGIAVDAAGRAHIAGMTSSSDFPVVNPWQPALGGHPAFRTRDGGAAWTALSAGLQGSAVSVFGFDRSQSGATYAGTTHGLFKTMDDGATWTPTGLPPQRVYAIADQAGASPAVFAAGDGGLYRSQDRGESWSRVSQYAWVSAVAVTQTSPAVVYEGMGYPANIQKSVDGGNTWIDTGLAGPVQLLAASGSTVYALTSAGLFRSSGGGAWVAVSGASHEGLSGFITAIAVDPSNPQIAYAGSSSGLFKTTSGGDAWTNVLGYATYVGAVVIAPSDPFTMFIATSGGLGITHDSGQTWSLSGLPSEVQAQVAAIAFDPADSAHMYVGCYMNADAFVATLSADGSRLEYATYIGGTRSEGATSIAVDSAGNRYVTGDTFSSDFPTVHPIQGAFGGLWDSFVVKLGPAGAPVYSTYLGGSATDYSARIAADGAGRAYVTGLTLSTNFPVVNASQPAHGGGYSDVFVTALNESGSAFVYSTYLGGNAMENDPGQSLGPSIAVTPSGDASVTGTTQSTNFPVTADAWHRTHAGGVNDVFLSTFDAAGLLKYSTFLGGPGADYSRDIAVDSIGTMFITGWTDSTDWATRTTVQPAYAGSEDGFVAKISPGTTPPDTIAPTTTIALSGTPGIPGWYTSPVTVSLSSVENDGGRGLAYMEYSLNGGPFKRYTTPLTVTTSGTTRVTARATDWAGNVETPPASAAVAIDTTGPVVSFQVTGTFGLGGWLKSSATVTVFGVDIAGTGVESVEYRIGNAAFQSYTAPFVISTDGVTQVTARATDRNGNVSTSTQTVSIDTSAPRASLALAGTSGLAGWYQSPVTVSLSAVDDAPGSGVATVEYRINDGVFQLYAAPFVVLAEGTTRITARATDRAGNVESPLPAALVMIDSSTPTVTIASPEPRDYQHSDSVMVSFSATDGMSGLQSVSAALDGGALQNSQSILLLTQTLGAHTIDVLAFDAAGNPAHRSVPFRVVATIDSLIASVNIFALQGKIDASKQRGLLATLNDAKAALDRGNRSVASAKLREFLDQCTAQSGRGISVDAAAVLTADTNYVLGTL